jgi:hypothetical protein
MQIWGKWAEYLLYYSNYTFKEICQLRSYSPLPVFSLASFHYFFEPVFAKVSVIRNNYYLTNILLPPFRVSFITVKISYKKEINKISLEIFFSAFIFRPFILLNQKETKNQESLMLLPSRPPLAR